MPDTSGVFRVSGGARLGPPCTHLAGICLAAWIGTEAAPWIPLAALLAVVGALLSRASGRTSALASVAMLTATIGALAAQAHLGHLTRSWPERSAARETTAQEELALSLDATLRSAEAATLQVAARWDASVGAEPALVAELRPPAVDALAVFGPSGGLLASDGTHQGPVPERVRRGASRYVYDEGAIFGYLYVTETLPDGGTAVAASLMRSDLPPGLERSEEDFESSFRGRTGVEVEVASADRAVPGSVWDLEWDGRSLLSVRLVLPSEADARVGLEAGWGRVVALLLALGWLLSLISTRRDARSALFGVGALAAVLLLLPLARLTGSGEVFSPAALLLPPPLSLTLGELLALGATGVFALALVPWDRLPRLPDALAVPAAVLLASGALALLERGSVAGLRAEGGTLWLVFQTAAVAVVLIPFAAASLLGRSRSPPSLRPGRLAASLALALLLCLAWVTVLERSPGSLGWAPWVWGIALLGVARSVSGLDRAAGAARWGALVFLSVTMVLPWAWGLRTEARMGVAEERIDRLGTRPDPFVEFLLYRAGERAVELASGGGRPVEVLYRAWSESGLAVEGLPLWITYWSGEGLPEEELRIGVSESRPGIPEELLEVARTDRRTSVRRFDLAEVHYVGVAPLSGGALLSVVIPPRRILEGASPLGPLFSPARTEPDPLVLIPLLPGEAPGETSGVRWVPTPDGWQGEAFIAYPDGVYHAHYLVESPGWPLLIARGGLLLMLNACIFGLIWGLGRWIREGRLAPVATSLAASGSFRGRVTFALFAFFLIPSLAFGTLAYRTLAGAAVRAGELLAERAVDDAGRQYLDGSGSIGPRRPGPSPDLLLYEFGELTEGSPAELVELGLYPGWVPAEAAELMEAGEAVTTTTTASLGGWEYVVAYRRLPGGRVIAAPAPLQAGATALGQREVTELIAFSLVVGGLLSVLLALAVGRALTRPIRTLSIASERVGGGNMDVQLPGERTDEFGAVFDAFNRMVDRLAKTRRALVRSSLRTRAIVEEVAIGVVALDERGHVALANPTAERLLGADLRPDSPLPRGVGGSDPGAAFREWIEGTLRDELTEAGTELSFGERRIRIRARRIVRHGPPGGTVVTLEDVTDELRTERILAWGEMAQQVAHEVKNPLTPIKLGVQHIRRAWLHGQPDYEEILERNVEAILDEIERLASIASSFSRYAPPSPAGAEPLESVALPEVIREVLDLYAAGSGPVSFSHRLLGTVPRVKGRAGEVKEVLVNLLENSRAALPRGGEVRIEVEPAEGEVELRVVDNGTGISDDLLPRVFEPHFSTRSSGTGLGLAIVRRLVESWGGRVHAESSPGDGLSIRIRMVAWMDPARVMREAGEDRRPARRHGGSLSPP